MAKIALAMTGVLLLGPGCLEREDFPVEPRIQFKAFDVFSDSASVTISFTDGDGDIGLDATDVLPPFDTGSTWYYNLFLTYEEMRNGQWVEPSLLLPYNYRVPRITPAGQNKALEGDISVALKPWPIAAPPFDTVRFSVTLVDRALNVSNTVHTEPRKLVP